jgi:PST family polysaccharide transporter
MKREFSIAAAWNAASSWLEQAAAALIFFGIARVIGVESFGIASMAFAFLFLAEFLVRDTITEAIIQRETLEKGRLDATFFVLVGFASLITLVLISIAPVISLVYKEPVVAYLLITASPTVLMIGLSGVSIALLRRRMEYRTLAIRTIAGVLAGGSVGIIMALNDFGVWSLVGQRLAELGVNSVLAILGAKWRPQHWPSRSEFALVLGLGPRVVELRAWMLVVTQSPVVMLGIFADPRAAGLFAFSARCIEILLKLSVKGIQEVAHSAIAETRRRNGATSSFFLELTELAAFAGFLCFAGLALIATPLTEVLLGSDWATASDIIPFLCVAGAIMSLTSLQEAYLIATDRLNAYLRAIRLEALLGFVIAASLSHLGAVAMAVGVAIRAILIVPLCTRAAIEAEGVSISDFKNTVRSPVLVTVAMIMCLLIWRQLAMGLLPDIAYLVLSVLLGITVALGIVAYFMPKTYQRLIRFVGKQ